MLTKGAQKGAPNGWAGDEACHLLDSSDEGALRDGIPPAPSERWSHAHGPPPRGIIWLKIQRPTLQVKFEPT